MRQLLSFTCFVILGILLSVVSLCAQSANYKNIVATLEEFKQYDDSVKVKMVFKIEDDKGIRLRDGLLVVPVLRANDDWINLQAVIFNGRVRNKLYTRQKAFDKDLYGYSSAIVMPIESHKGGQEITYNASVPFKKWMEQASLYLQEVRCPSCGRTRDTIAEYLLAGKLEVKRPPKLIVSFVAPPEKQEEKSRSEMKSAYLKFVSGSAVIDLDFRNNRYELQRVDSLISRIVFDKDVSINKINITGYASIEGKYATNLDLSEKRAKAFQAYLQDTYDLPYERIQTKWVGEDWDGLKRFIEEGNMPMKFEVLNIINSTKIFDGREKRLMVLNKGEPYKFMMEWYFPLLRRMDYEIDYEIKKYSVNEAAEVLRTKSDYLVLSELYALARQHDPTSAKFKEVMDVAVSLYPDDPVANINAMATYIINEQYDLAACYMPYSGESGEALNNKGIIEFVKGNTVLAEEYFVLSKDLGCPEAEQNLTVISQYNKLNNINN